MYYSLAAVSSFHATAEQAARLSAALAEVGLAGPAPLLPAAPAPTRPATRGEFVKPLADTKPGALDFHLVRLVGGAPNRLGIVRHARYEDSADRLLFTFTTDRARPADTLNQIHRELARLAPILVPKRSGRRAPLRRAQVVYLPEGVSADRLVDLLDFMGQRGSAEPEPRPATPPVVVKSEPGPFEDYSEDVEFVCALPPGHRYAETFSVDDDDDC